MGEFFSTISSLDWKWIPAIAIALHVLLSTIVGIHIILHKKPVQSAIGWLGVVVLSPFIGGLLYLCFGINRIQRRGDARRTFLSDWKGFDSSQFENERKMLRLTQALGNPPPTAHNSIQTLVNGDEAFPEQLAAIHRAQSTIALASYIFNFDEIGREFVDALVQAHERGVLVYVLVDDVGTHYSSKPIDKVLKARGVKTARFMNRWAAQIFRFVNLRSHRKVLLVDGQVAFIGGMNIQEGNALKRSPAKPEQDIHFKVQGPVIDVLNRIFEEDWQFSCHEKITLPLWKAPQGQTGQNAFISAIAEGPDRDFEKLKWVFLAALSAAETSVQIVTPYFLPDTQLTRALELAALQGVEVEVIIPEKSNLRFVDWAMEATYDSLIKRGVKIYRSAGPFDHSKIFVVDGAWASVGSSNWDERSLRLNFELNISVVDSEFLSELGQVIKEKRERSRLMTLEQIEAWSLLRRVRNGLTCLLSPYL